MRIVGSFLAAREDLGSEAMPLSLTRTAGLPLSEQRGNGRCRGSGWRYFDLDPVAGIDSGLEHFTHGS
jgi:hypothetical protein